MTGRRRRNVVLTAIGVLMVLAMFVMFSGLWTRFVHRPGIENALVGRTEADIRRVYGELIADRSGYESVGLRRPDHLPPGSIRTLSFRPGGLFRSGVLSHLEGGWLTVWLWQAEGEWKCFESLWVAENVEL